MIIYFYSIIGFSSVYIWGIGTYSAIKFYDVGIYLWIYYGTVSAPFILVCYIVTYVAKLS